MDIIKKLPEVFQTPAEKKFFNATVDQVFSKKDNEYLSGYIGRRVGGVADPVNDFYVPEPDKNRTWHQLEATAYARDINTSRTNILFYDDLINKINVHGGLTGNHDRLFSSEYYSWSPPIDVDMFVNYNNYFWIEYGLQVISIRGVLGADIIGHTNFVTPTTAIPPNVKLSSGMKILLVDDPLYAKPVIIENVGKGVGIRLVPVYRDYTAGTIMEQLPWDGSVRLLDGRVIDNTRWDALPWDIHPAPGNTDYITMERGSLDENAWSRTNKWYHVDTITTVAALTGTTFPPATAVATRPIIQFDADLELYKSGTQFKATLDYGFTSLTSGAPIVASLCDGESVSYFGAVTGVTIVADELICFFNDTSLYNSTTTPVNHIIFKVNIADGVINLSEYGTVIDGDTIFISESGGDTLATIGTTWFYSNGVWQEAYNDKMSTNQPILFQLFDHGGVKLDDATKYPGSSFAGNNIFSYKKDTTPGAYVDPVLKFPIMYTSLNQSSDIIFKNNLITDKYTYSDTIPINGYYYYKKISKNVLYNSWNLHNASNGAQA